MFVTFLWCMHEYLVLLKIIRMQGVLVLKSNVWDVLTFHLCYSIIGTVFRKNRSDFFLLFFVPTFMNESATFPTKFHQANTPCTCQKRSHIFNLEMADQFEIYEIMQFERIRRF
jgi:hypothetical protein